MFHARQRHWLVSLAVCCTLLSRAWAEAPRVLPAGQLPQDKRLGPLLDLDGYFPFTPCSTREAWQQRAAQLPRQVLVAAGAVAHARQNARHMP